MRSALTVFLFASALSLQAQTPYLVTDLNTTASADTQSSSPNWFTAFGGRVYFTATTAATGLELWSSDGVHGATLVADIVPGTGDSSPAFPTVVNGKLLFTARDVNHGIEWWTTDGTEAGTHMLLDLNPGPSSATPFMLAVLKNGMLFLADDGTHGRELWFTDGTSSGTRLVKDITPGAGGTTTYAAFRLGDIVYLDRGGEIWQTDGTEAGTVKALTVSGRAYTPVGSKFFFIGRTDASGSELWISDGTQAGTHIVTDIRPGPDNAFDSSSFSSFTRFGNGIIFFANDGVHGRELWVSDGTAAGTRMVRDLLPGAKGAFDNVNEDIGTIGGRAYFTFEDADHGAELWSTDGTDAGTSLLADLLPGPAGSRPLIMANSSGTIYFQTVGAGITHGLWITDGGAPRQLGTTAGLVSTPGLFWPVGTKYYFNGVNSLTGNEPWVTDGTEAGTYMLANLAADGAPSSNPRSLTAVGNTLLFEATGDGSNGGAATAETVWRSDGTAGGTFRLLPDQSRASGFIALGPIALFTNSDAQKPMLTDGTLAGTIPADSFLLRFGTLKNIEYHPFGNDLYFTGSDTYGATAVLWHTTPQSDASAVRLGAENPNSMVQVAGRLYFYANAQIDRGIWTTDGTPGGTYAVIPDLGVDYGSLSRIVTMDGALYFLESGKDGTVRLMKNDGSLDGTVVIKEFPPQTVNDYLNIAATAHHVFFVLVSGLWGSDGTEAGTLKLADIHQYGGDLPMIPNGDRLIFDEHSDYNAPHQLWSSDGTVAGTVLLQQGNTLPFSPATLGGVTYFAGHDDLHGTEPWTTDGTLTGTKLLYDVNPGTASSNPREFTKAGELIYFPAYTDAAGYELWALPLTTPQLSIGDARAAEGNSGTTTMHFSVTLQPASNRPVTVDYATADSSAHAGEDYDAASGTLTFAPGETSKSIDVRIHGDTAHETDETLLVRLRNASGADLARPDGFGVIEEDDQSSDIALSLTFSNNNSDSVGNALKITNIGPSDASGLTWNILSTSTWPACGYQLNCSIPTLASNASVSPYLYGTPTGQTYVSATISAHQNDPQPANNTIAWTVSNNAYLAMDAAFLTPGGKANIAGISYSNPPSITSSDPSVVSLGPLTINGNYVQTTATALKAGTSTITTTYGSMLVMVVPQGTTPRWPAGVQLAPGFTATNFDQAITVTASATGVAPFTGATPTGTISVVANGHELARAPFSGKQTISLPAYLPALGTVPYSIVYSGDDTFAPQTVNATVFVHQGAATLLATIEPSGQAQYTLKVKASGSPAAAPSGIVIIMNGSTEVTRLTLAPSVDGTSSSAQAVISAPSAPPTLTLTYPGDTFYVAGTQQVRAVAPHRHAAGH